ncbi:MAG: dienelactone hydrolase family protein [Phenylobacterium sp.]|uniref:dienelactone hydrolase family protein n=1 Tax=Phenylobacterium sp. TaxID=1871053 RepID=UPI00391A452C
MGWEKALAEYERFEFSDGPWTRPVFRRGSGPAVIVIHEMPGLHPEVLPFANRVAAAGMTVYLPSLFGDPGRPVTNGYAMGAMLKGVCISREFNVWAAGKSSPIVEWLRALARRAHGECGGKGVGAVGMCFTGGFALAMMTEPAVVAPVLSQPSLPLTVGLGGRRRASGVDASSEEIACARRRFAEEDLSMIGLRFEGDPIVPRERFDALEREFGDKFERWDIDPSEARPGGLKHPHSVLTINLKNTGKTQDALIRVLAFFREKTGVS